MSIDRVGNTKMSQWGEWSVEIIDRASRSAMVRWNGNAQELWPAYRLESLYLKSPKCIRDQRERGGWL